MGVRRAICWSVLDLGSHFARSPQLGRSRMTRHRARSFQLESLEGKQLLSTLHPAHHASSKPAPLVLNGTLKEIEGQNVSGYSGELKSLGQVVANVDPPTGKSSATNIVVTGANGSVTLNWDTSLSLLEVGRNSEISAFPYTIVSGTGAYTGAKGSGVLEEPGQGYCMLCLNSSPTLTTTFRLHTNRSTYRTLLMKFGL
jgi:hypothetical protein